MTQTTTLANLPTRKPRVALMGEFSAGKSTLSNLLLGADPLPVKVTATRLPPVWVSYGEATATREDLNGNSFDIDITKLEAVALEETSVIRLGLKSDMLRLCDLIDMPGISDPNMEASVWQSVIGEADHVIWCSHATQAWRQSEAAVWESLPERIRQKSLLLLTRFDKLLNTRDRERVLARVRRESEGLFAGVYPISLTQALNAGEDRQAWEDSGGEAFVMQLIELLTQQDDTSDAEEGKATALDSANHSAQPIDLEQSSSIRVMPSRVRMKSGGQKRPRCKPQAGASLVPDQNLLEIPGYV